MIEVSDNGAGMGRSDIALALERHATSKLPDDAIENVVTLGFRGEAPPSIASVAHLSIESRQRSEEHTSELQSLMRISYAVFCLTKKTNDIASHFQYATA